MAIKKRPSKKNVATRGSRKPQFVQMDYGAEYPYEVPIDGTSTAVRLLSPTPRFDDRPEWIELAWDSLRNTWRIRGSDSFLVRLDSSNTMYLHMEKR